MASNLASRSTEILSSAANAFTSMTPQNHLPHQRRWKVYWYRFWCFGPQRRTKRIIPASEGQEGNTIEMLSNGPQQAGGGHQPTNLSHQVAPPSSPASLMNSANPSSVPSPSTFLCLSSMSFSACSPVRRMSTMFATGPYAYETQLVTPPVFSTLTTEPSTASFTPPEFAQPTNPPSPEVPFSKLLASSLNTEARVQEHGLSISSFPLTSSGYGASSDTLSVYQLHPGSPAGSLVSPRWGFSGSGSSSPFTDLEFPSQRKGWNSTQDSFFLRNEPSKLFNHESRSSMLSQDSDVLHAEEVQCQLPMST